MVGFSSFSVVGLLGTNFVNFLIPISFLFIRSQPKFESCTTASLNQRAAVVYTGTMGSVSPSLSVGFTKLKPIQLRPVRWLLASVNKATTSSDQGKPKQVLRLCTVRLT